MAEVVADRLLGGAAEFPGADMSTKLKLLGVDVASFGDAMGGRRDCARGRRQRPGQAAPTPSWCSPTTPRRCSAASWSATPRAYGVAAAAWSARELPGDPLALIAPAGPAAARRSGSARCPTAAQVCSCNAVTKGDLTARSPTAAATCPRSRLHQGRHHLRLVRAAAQAAARRRGRRAVQGAVRALQPVARRAVRDRPGHRDPHLLRADRERYGTGRGCDICKPAVASILASTGSEHILDGEQAVAAGHQRPLPGQHPAQRHLLGGAADARRRDHARAADRDRRGGPGLRPLHQDHRWSAHRPVRRPGGAAAARSGGGWSTPGSSPATPTARRCAR